MAEIHVKGLAELNKFFDDVPAKVERNVMRDALRAGANAILPEARANIHNVSGDLARSLKVRSGARGGRVTASVYTRLYYAKFVEFGTRPHKITARDGALMFGGTLVDSVNHPGIKPRPFLRPALDRQAQAALVAAGLYIKNRLATKHGLDTSDVEVE